MTLFPGATSVTFLRVYDDAAADGIIGGTPHLHTASTEGYVVTGGHGELHTIDSSGFRITSLRPGTIAWFTPGTVHRVVNGGSLTVVCVMQNSGLPEAGDAVMTFPPDVVGDAERYRRAAMLPDDESKVAPVVRARRDLAVEGFQLVKDAAEAGDSRPLERLRSQAAALVQPRVETWVQIWQNGAHAEARHTGEVLSQLASSDATSLADGALFTADGTGSTEGWGMCGRLRTFDLTPR